MYTAYEMPAEFEELERTTKTIAGSILARIPPLEESVLLEIEYDFEKDRGKHFYVLRDGNIKYESHGKLLFYLDEGDLILPLLFSHKSTARFSLEFAVRVDRIDEEGFQDLLGSDHELRKLWDAYLRAQIGIRDLAVASLLKEEPSATPGCRTFEQGDVIIEQGATDDIVYTLLKGQADVFVDGTKVGEVFDDEVFGALAPLTETPRSATVKAVTRCTVLSLPKENFSHLLETRPATAARLLQDMARVIVDLNREVVGAAKAEHL